MAVTIGSQLGSYEITALLGKGGFGEVYRAKDKKLKREVAIKILPDEFYSTTNFDTFVRVDGKWVAAVDQKMDCALVLREGAPTCVKQGQVKAGEMVAEWDPYTIPILTEASGVVKFGDILEGVTMEEKVDERTGLSTKVVVDTKELDRRPRISIKDAGGQATPMTYMWKGRQRSMRYTLMCMTQSHQEPRTQRANSTRSSSTSWSGDGCSCSAPDPISSTSLASMAISVGR